MGSNSKANDRMIFNPAATDCKKHFSYCISLMKILRFCRKIHNSACTIDNFFYIRTESFFNLFKIYIKILTAVKHSAYNTITIKTALSKNIRNS